MSRVRSWAVVAAVTILTLAGAAPTPAAAADELSISPIGVTFVQAEFASHYRVSATPAADRPVTYRWSLQPPAADPGCNKFDAGNTAEAVWHHGDQDGCNHNVQGSQGHLGTVTVVVTDGRTSCTASVLGSETMTGPAPTCTQVAAPPTSAVAAPPASAVTTTATTEAPHTGGGSSPALPIALGAIVLLAVIAGGVLVARRRGEDDCAELVARCQQLRTAATAAAKAAADAKAAHDAAAKALAAAQRAAAAADRPDEGESWMEDADTHERITEHDLALERADGGNQWGDPAHRAELRAAEKQRAHEALDRAQADEAATKAAADRAATAAAKAAADADVACKAAEACQQAAAAAKAAAATPPTPPPSPPPTPPEPPVTPGTVSPPVVQTPPPPVVIPPVATRPPECEDGCEPRVETTSKELELILVWAAEISIDGAFQFSEADVDAARRGYEKFKVVVEIAEFVEGFAESGGDLAGGGPGVDSVLNVVTTGGPMILDYFGVKPQTDPSGETEDAVGEALDKLIAQINRKRLLGEWTIKAPLVKVTAACEHTYVCKGGHWVLAAHRFTLTYGDKIRDITLPPARNDDVDNPERGARATKARLERFLETRNRAARAEITAIVKRCAAAK